MVPGQRAGSGKAAAGFRSPRAFGRAGSERACGGISGGTPLPLRESRSRWLVGRGFGDWDSETDHFAIRKTFSAKKP